MHWKKSIASLALVLVAVASFNISASADTIINGTVMVNNQQVTSNVLSVNEGGILLTPVKELMSAIGGSFYFDSTKLTGTLKKGENELVFRLDDSVVKYNGKYIKAPIPLKIVNNRFMVPAQFVSVKFSLDSYMNINKGQLLLYQPTDGKITYKVQQNDTLWIISQLFGTSISTIKQLNGLASDSINVGQNLVIKNFIESNTAIPAQTTNSTTIVLGPGWSYGAVGYLKSGTSISIVGKNGSWYKVLTPNGNGYIFSTVVSITQDLTDTAADSKFFDGNIPLDTSKDFITYSPYTVQKGDSLWSIADKNGMLDYELAVANNLSLSSGLTLGQVLSIPIHNVPVKSTLGSQRGEVLDWFKEAQYIFPTNKVGKFIDIQTGKSFMAQRTIGATHSDTETLTLQDTQTMKEIFGGSWTWNRRPFLLQVDGRQISISVQGMPHAGIDGIPYLKVVDNRSGDFGTGPNYDKISGNGLDGHFDVYFLNCLRHVDNKIDPYHQYNVLVSAGLE